MSIALAGSAFTRAAFAHSAFAHSAFAHSVAQAPAAHDIEGAALLLEWTFDPTFLLPLLLALLYFRGLRRYRRSGRSLFPRRRPVFFGAGIAIIALALLSPIDALSDFSFTWHMIQHMLLTMVAVPLVLLGAPFIPVLRGLPGGFRQRYFIPFARNPAVRWFFINMTRPLPGLALYALTFWGWHYPPFYDAALNNEAVHYLEHFLFVFTAVFFWWNIVPPYPFNSRINHLLRMAYLFLAMIQNNALGIVISFSTTVLYAYSGMEGFRGMSMEDDQLLGAVLMWLVGAMMYIGAIAAVFVQLASEDQGKRGATPRRAG